MPDLEGGRGGALERLRFFLLWLQRPGRLGAAVPSGRRLAQAMAAEVDVGRPGLVVELGGGTGNVTAALLAAGVSVDDLIVVEREAALAASLRRRFPHVTVIRGDARRLGALLARKSSRLANGTGWPDAAPGQDRPSAASKAEVKAVVSSLPLLLFGREEQEALLAEVFALLPEDAPLVQFTYGPRAPIVNSVARRLGLAGTRAQWVLDNVPPAAVWTYRRPSALLRLADSA